MLYRNIQKLVLAFLILTLWVPLGKSQGTMHFAEVINLSESEIKVFTKRTQQKVEEFQAFMKIIADKTQSRDRRNLAELEALKLFYEGAVIEITSADKSQVTKRTIKEYLYRLKILPYAQVNIDYYDVAYVTTFKKGPDGKYYATATIFQKITGFDNERMVYSRHLKKEIEVVLENVVDEFYGESRWKIFLGDIKATEVKV